MTAPRVWLGKAAIRDFRNLERVDLDFPETGLAIVGENERLWRRVGLPQRPERTLEGAALRILIPSSDRSLATIEHLQDERQRLVGVVDQMQGGGRVDLRVEAPPVEMRRLPLRRS